MSFLNFLTTKNIISAEQAPFLKEQIKNSDKKLDSMLLEKGLGKEELLELKGEYFGVPYKNLETYEIPFEILKYISEESSIHYKIAPLGVVDNVLEVGIVDPANIEARDALNFMSIKEDLPFKLFLISEDDFAKVLEVYKGLSGQVNEALTELESELSEEEKEIQKQLEGGGNKDSTHLVEDAPVTKIVATILRYAVEYGASDVHIEPLSDKVRVRFRIDGVLNTSIILPLSVEGAVAARVKILAQMKLDEKRKPQDGRFQARIDGRKIDFRVSTFPTYFGEKVVMRILDQHKGVKKMDELGLSDRYLAMLKSAIKKSYGMILISGPTGSGKSTTLYSVLEELDSGSKNILSLEDPVEYTVEGVNQSQVRADIGYTFANGLRTTLRQDPDIIMVGEIRDGETAKLAIQAALTGHLVLSTIHTNTSCAIIPRLIDMGVDPYLIPPTLILGVAQRLVRKLCPNSGEVMLIEGSTEVMIQKQFEDLPEEFRNEIPHAKEMLKIKPTSDCPNGTKGREAVFEMFPMSKEIESMILKNPVESEIYKVARSQGLITMKEDAIRKAMQKIIPFEEIGEI
jgi:type IV pilus assembly protein PilB